MRETLNITGGSLTINYDPNYVSDTVNYPNPPAVGSDLSPILGSRYAKRHR